MLQSPLSLSPVHRDEATLKREFKHPGHAREIIRQIYFLCVYLFVNVKASCPENKHTCSVSIPGSRFSGFISQLIMSFPSGIYTFITSSVKPSDKETWQCVCSCKDSWNYCKHKCYTSSDWTQFIIMFKVNYEYNNITILNLCNYCIYSYFFSFKTIYFKTKIHTGA